MKFLIDAGNTMLQSRELSESDPFEDQTNIIIAAVALGSALTLAAVYFRPNIAQCYTSLFGQSVATNNLRRTQNSTHRSHQQQPQGDLTRPLSPNTHPSHNKPHTEYMDNDVYNPYIASTAEQEATKTSVAPKSSSYTSDDDEVMGYNQFRA